MFQQILYLSFVLRQQQTNCRHVAWAVQVILPLYSYCTSFEQGTLAQRPKLIQKATQHDSEEHTGAGSAL